MTWQQQGACVGMPDVVFFAQIPSYESRARFVCSLCPVTLPCLRAAIDNGDRGVRGGLTYQERRKVLKMPRTQAKEVA